MKFGPTGDFPRGKVDESDEGGLQVGITYDKESDTVVIVFGKSITWIGFGPEQAIEFANLIIERAKKRE